MQRRWRMPQLRRQHTLRRRHVYRIDAVVGALVRRHGHMPRGDHQLVRALHLRHGRVQDDVHGDNGLHDRQHLRGQRDGFALDHVGHGEHIEL